MLILDEDDSDNDMMRYKDNEKPSWSSLISLVHVLLYISGRKNGVNVLSLFTGIAGGEACFA